jgi:hypothetical protein
LVRKTLMDLRPGSPIVIIIDSSYLAPHLWIVDVLLVPIRFNSKSKNKTKEKSLIKLILHIKIIVIVDFL